MATDRSEVEAKLRQLDVAEKLAKLDLADRAAKLEGDPVALRAARVKNDDLGAFLREKASAPLPGETEEQTFERQFGGLPEDKPGLAENLARSTFQGVSAAFGDEIVSNIGAGVRQLAGKDEGRSFGEVRDLLLDKERGNIERFRRDSPVLAIGSEVAGAIPTALAGASAVGTGGSLLSQMLRGGAVGGAEGAVFGFGAGEGGLQHRAISAGRGGGIGAVAGGAGAPIMNALGRGVSRAVQRATAPTGGMPRAARDVLQQSLSADDSLARGAQRITQAGDEAMLADAGQNARALLDTAIQRSGRAGVVAREAIERRATVANRSLGGALDNAFGPPRGIRAVETALRKTTQTARSDAYRKAYAAPIDYATDRGQELQTLMGRVPRSAINSANTKMRAEGAQSAQILASMADDGSVTFQRLPDIRQIDYVTRGLNDMAGRARNSGALDDARLWGNLSRDIRSAARELVSEYDVALNTAAHPLAARDALMLGRNALTRRIPLDELAENLQRFDTKAEREFVAVGVRGHIDEVLSNVKRTISDPNVEARQAVRAITELSSDASRDKIRLVIGDDAANKLIDKIDEAAAALDLRAAVADNSKTFARTALDQTVRAQTEDGVINALRGGQPVDAGRRLVQAVGGRTAADKARIADDTFSAVADQLVNQRGPNALRALQVLQARQGIEPNAIRAGELAEILARGAPGAASPASR